MLTPDQKEIWQTVFLGRLLGDSAPDRMPDDRIADAQQVADKALAACLAKGIGISAE